ncbi:MAG: Crp/Fnr family transcriptional regulator [Lautropia sp.]
MANPMHGNPGTAPPPVAPGDAPQRACADRWHDSHWARTLNATEIARVRDDMIVREYPGGSVVSRKGEPAVHWIGVLDGLMKISSVSPEGKPVSFAGIPTGGWFGEGSLLKDEPRHYDVVALRDSVVGLMPRATFRWLLDQSIAFNRFLLVQLNERLAQFIATVEFDRLLDPDARVARCIASLFNPHLYPDTGARLSISQEEIGYLSGISRQRVNQALQTLERAQLLRIDYGALTVLDVGGLATFNK